MTKAAGSVPSGRLRGAGRIRAVVVALGVLVSLFVAAVLGAGEVMSSPSRSAIGPPPEDLAATSVHIPVSRDVTLSGWFIHGRPGAGAVLLLHGVRGSRYQMVGRARFLHGAGYGVLLVDLPAHGESGGDRITFGYREADSVEAAMRFLRTASPGERIGIIGVSLGAASAVFAGRRAAPDAVVLESMFPTITEAVADRLQMRIGPLGRWLAPVLLWQLPLRLGIGADRLRPIERVGVLGAPVLIASGSADRQTPIDETMRLYAAAVEPKELWIVDGAAHVDLQQYAPTAYEPRILQFLASHLRQGGG